MNNYHEPWVVSEWKILSDDAEGTNILSFPTNESLERIVSCVNACEGIENPSELRKERDELLKAMSDLLKVCAPYAPCGMVNWEKDIYNHCKDLVREN